MTNTANSKDLCERIEHLVGEYISATRVAAQAALDRAFATARRQGRGSRVRRRRPRAVAQARDVRPTRSKR